MNDFSSILGARDETDISKFIFGAVFVVIWLISAALSALNKQKEKARRRQILEQTDREARQQPRSVQQRSQSAPPPLPDMILRQLPNPLPPQLPPQQRKVQKKFNAKKPKPVAVPAQTTYEEQYVPARQVVPPPVARVRPTDQPQPATAETINRWLKPTTLRQQFILTEVLQPPKSLRGE